MTAAAQDSLYTPNAALKKPLRSVCRPPKRTRDFPLHAFPLLKQWAITCRRRAAGYGFVPPVGRVAGVSQQPLKRRSTRARQTTNCPPGPHLLHYNRFVKTWDVVIIGGGVIGLSLAWRLRRDGASVLIVEREASRA